MEERFRNLWGSYDAKQDAEGLDKKILDFIYQERKQWERELREKIESLEATTWGNTSEYLAKDDVLALLTHFKRREEKDHDKYGECSCNCTFCGGNDSDFHCVHWAEEKKTE